MKPVAQGMRVRGRDSERAARLSRSLQRPASGAACEAVWRRWSVESRGEERGEVSQSEHCPKLLRLFPQLDLSLRRAHASPLCSRLFSAPLLLPPSLPPPPTSPSLPWPPTSSLSSCIHPFESTTRPLASRRRAHKLVLLSLPSPSALLARIANVVV